MRKQNLFIFMKLESIHTCSTTSEKICNNEKEIVMRLIDWLFYCYKTYATFFFLFVREIIDNDKLRSKYNEKKEKKLIYHTK